MKKPAAGKNTKKPAKPVAKKAVKKPVPKAAPSKAPKSKTSSKSSKSTSKKPVQAVKAVVKKLVKKTPSKPIQAKPSPASNKVSSAKKLSKSNKISKTQKPSPVETKVVKPIKVEVKKAASAKVDMHTEEVIKPVTKTTKPEEKSKKALAAEAKEAKGRDVLAITNTIPVAPKHEISASKIASISQSITNPIRRNDSYAVKVEKEPNGKFELEFVFHASAEMLYEFVSTASGLSEWFCDDLNIRNGIYTFIWEDQLQQARLLKTVDLQIVRFQWVEKTDGSYFEFRIQKDDLTNDISLIVTDFAESVSERESSKLLWNSQVEKLRHVLGSIF